MMAVGKVRYIWSSDEVLTFFETLLIKKLH